MNDYQHHIPGRLRIRSKRMNQDLERRSRVLRQLQTTQGVRSVSINRKAGSVTVIYEAEKIDLEQILGLLKSGESQIAASTPKSRPSRHGNISVMIGKMALSVLVNKSVSYSFSSLLGART